MSKQVILDWKESTGSSNAYVVWIDWPWYYDGQTIRFVANHANTWAATLSVSWKTAIAIKKNNDVALVAWDIEANQIVLVSYNANDNVFELLSPTWNVPTAIVSDSYIKTDTITITSAEVLALNTTPKQLIAAPWVWKYIIVDSLTASIDYNSAAYATNTTLQFKYTNWTWDPVVSDMSWLLNTTADKAIRWTWSTINAIFNAPIVCLVQNWDPTAWNSDVKVNITYRVLSI